MLLTPNKSEEFQRRLREAVEAGLKARGVSARKASIEVVGNDGLVRDIRAGVLPSADRIQALFDYLGVGYQFGPQQRSEPPAEIEVAGASYARIPLHNAWVSAGPGISNGDVAIVDHLVFRDEWLRKIEVKPESAAMARVSGDSMAPGIRDGDLILIDTSRREVPIRRRLRRPDQLPIFAFMQDSEARVKRLERLPKERIVVLYSDNKDIPPEVIGESEAVTLNILGQVVWSGHVWR